MISMGNPENVQLNLKRLMDLKGWSLKRLAIESKVSYHTVFRAISKGVIPRGGNLQKLANALGCSVGDLYETSTDYGTNRGIAAKWTPNPTLVDQITGPKAEPFAEVFDIVMKLAVAPRDYQILVIALLKNDPIYLKQLSPQFRERLQKILKVS